MCGGVRIANKHILKQDLSSFPELASSQMNSIVKFPLAEFRCFLVYENWWPHKPSTWSEESGKTFQVFGGSVSAVISKISSVEKAHIQLIFLHVHWLSSYCLKNAIKEYEKKYFSVSVLNFSCWSWQPLRMASCSVFCLYSPAVLLDCSMGFFLHKSLWNTNKTWGTASSTPSSICACIKLWPRAAASFQSIQ